MAIEVVLLIFGEVSGKIVPRAWGHGFVDLRNPFRDGGQPALCTAVFSTVATRSSAMDTVTSAPSSKSSGSNGVSTPFAYLAFTLAIMPGPFGAASPAAPLYRCQPPATDH